MIRLNQIVGSYEKLGQILINLKTKSSIFLFLLVGTIH